MKLFLTTFLFAIASFSFAQDTITAEKANSNIGKEVVLKGKIASFKLASEGKSTNFINVDKAYPNNIFTVVLTNKYLQEKNIQLFNSKGKKIMVKGTISIYENDPKKIPQIFNPTFLEIR